MQIERIAGDYPKRVRPKNWREPRRCLSADGRRLFTAAGRHLELAEVETTAGGVTLRPVGEVAAEGEIQAIAIGARPGRSTSPYRTRGRAGSIPWRAPACRRLRICLLGRSTSQ